MAELESFKKQALDELIEWLRIYISTLLQNTSRTWKRATLYGSGGQRRQHKRRALNRLRA